MESFYIYVLCLQIVHSLEELTTGFHKRWYLFKMPFWVFLLFEIIFTSFWILILLNPGFPNRELFQKIFVLLMFANGIQHLVWFGVEKKYVPGLITAPIHVLLFSYFYL